MEEKIPNRVSARYVLITIDEKQRRPVTRIFGTTRVPLLFANQQKITLQQRHAATTLLHKSRLIFACGNSHLASAGPLLCLFYDYDGREHRPRMLYRNLIFAML